MKKGDRFELHFTVSEMVYSSFIETFKDKNPLHTSNAFALSKGFKGKVMHGNILNGFVSYFIGEVLPEKNVIIHSQEIKFKNPVYLLDVLHFTATIEEVFESVNVVEFAFTFKNQGAKSVATGKIQIGLLADKANS